jgi:hypothetical protein
MRNRVQFSRSYRDIENEYESEEAFVQHWTGRVDWEANPHLDRIDSDGNYCKSNNQWLSAEEHRLKSAKEAAKLTDKQALEVIKAAKPCRVAARENEISHMTAHKILTGQSYRWLLREEENENGNGRLGI